MTTPVASPRPSRPAPGRPIVTAALLTSGSLLAATGLTMLAAGLGAPVAAYKAWMLFGVSQAGVANLHKVAAVAFLGSAGVHISNNRRIIGRHITSLGHSPPPKLPAPPRRAAA
ncbi:MAG: DUF4405 domain-containing protein [Candidatus Competibacterales bacterium]